MRDNYLMINGAYGSDGSDEVEVDDVLERIFEAPLAWVSCTRLRTPSGSLAWCFSDKAGSSSRFWVAERGDGGAHLVSSS